jgi:hypothetical protein
MSISIKTEGKDAPAIMKERGTETDQAVLTYIMNNSDCTVKQIADDLDMTNGRVDNSVKRLYEKKLINVQYYRRNRGLIKKISFSNQLPQKYDEVEFPLRFLNKESWNKTAFICAKSRSTMKIQSNLDEVSKNDCLSFEEIEIKTIKNKLFMKIPERFVHFYELPNSELGISGYDDELLLTVESTIIPLEVPYGYEQEFELNYHKVKLYFEAEYISCKPFKGSSSQPSESNLTLPLSDLLKGVKIPKILVEGSI